MIDTVSYPAASREPADATSGAKQKAESLNIARKIVDAHLRKSSTISAHTASETSAAGGPPSQQNDWPATSSDHDDKDALPQEGLLAIIMDVCKLHVNDALHDLQPPAEPARTSYLELDSSDEEEVPGASAPQVSNNVAGDWEKMRPLPLQARLRKRSKEHDDQWTTEKEQTKTHLTEIIRGHISRHMYLIRLCRALMLYGAPTHRLEE